MSSLSNKLKSSRNFLSGLLLSSIISTSAFSAEPLKISPDKYGAWNTPVKVEMTETKLNYDVLEKRKVPLYLYGEKNEAEKSVTITYSTFPQNENMPNNPLQINTLDSKFYILKPADVEIKIEQGDWSNFRGKLVASKLKEKQPISLEKLLLDATEKGIDFLRQADPVQAFSDGLDSSGKLGNEASIYGIINKLCSGQDEKYKKTLQEKYAGELELVKVDLKSNDSGAIHPRVGKMVKATIFGNYSGAKIPLVISQQIALGNTSQGLRGENPFFGQLETIAEFEFDNPNAGKATTPSSDFSKTLSGKWEVIIPGIFMGRSPMKIYTISKVSEKEITLEMRMPAEPIKSTASVLPAITIKLAQNKEGMFIRITENNQDDSYFAKRISDQQYIDGLGFPKLRNEKELHQADEKLRSLIEKRNEATKRNQRAEAFAIEREIEKLKIEEYGIAPEQIILIKKH